MQALQRVRPNLATELTQPPTKPANANSGAAAAELTKLEQQEHVQLTKEETPVSGTKAMETQPESKDGTAADGQLEAKTADQGGAGDKAALPENAGVFCAASPAKLSGSDPSCLGDYIEAGVFSAPCSCNLETYNSEQESPWRLMGERRWWQLPI